jgi:hypothetical protein
MGQAIATFAGGAIGFALGGPLGAQIGMLAGGMIGSTLFGPTIKGPRLNDLKVSASTYGTAIPRVWGSVRIPGNMIWSSGIKEAKKTSRAGKGGPKQTTYTYSASFAVGLCRGEITDVTRIWADSKLLYDKTSGTARDPIKKDNGGLVFTTIVKSLANKKKKRNVKFRVYPGNETQLPDGLIEAHKGAGNVSAHRGLAYVVFENLELEDYGNRIPQLTFEVSRAVSTSFPSILTVAEDGTSRPNWIGDRKWIPDWSLGRLLSFTREGGNTNDVFNLADMRKVFGKTGDNLYFSSREVYVPSKGLLLRTPNYSNSGRLEVWDALTLTKIQTYGIDNINLNGFVDVSVEPPRIALANSGKIGYGHSMEGRMIVLMTGWTKDTWCINLDDKVPLFHVKAPWEPNGIIEGRTSQAFAEIVSYRSANSRLELRIWKIGGRAMGGIVPGSGGAMKWEQTKDWTATDINLQPYGTEAFSARVVLFDPTDECLFVIGSSAGVTTTFKYSLVTGNYKFLKKHPGLPLPLDSMRYSTCRGGTFGYGYAAYRQTGKLIEIDLQTGDVSRNDAFGNAFGDQLYFGANQKWNDDSTSLIVNTRNEYRRILFSSGISEIGLKAVVQEVCLNGGILKDIDIDMSGLNDEPLVGYMIDREATGKDVLRQLGTGFLFDGFESDYTLKFKSRGNAAVVNITEDWIERNGDGEVVKETLTQELEMPMRVTVNYYDITRDHQQGSQSQKRISGPVPSMWSAKDDIVDLPIVWTPDQGKQAADKLLKMAWANRTTFELGLPWRYLKYDPTDVATVTLNNGTVFTMRFSEVNMGADLNLAIQAQSEKASAYVSVAKGQPSDVPEQSISSSYPVYPLILNTPLLRDVDYNTANNAACYFSVGTKALEFTSAYVFMDDGYEFQPVGGVNDDAVSGHTLTALPATKSYEATDERTILKVRLSNPAETLESVTQDAMLTTFANAAIVGNEVIQFRDAVQQANGEWWLSGILRARRGTNYAVNGHVVGEQFVLVNDATVSVFNRPPQDYTVTREFRAVGPGEVIEDAEGVTSKLVPRDLMPFTPEDVKVTDNGTTVTITMQRRSRVTSPLVDGTGTIHYKEGEKGSGKIVYKLWHDLDITKTNTLLTPNKDASVAIFDSVGNDVTPTITFPLADLGASTKFLLRLAEVGVVEGTPKWVAFERLGQNRWNMTDLY